MKRTLSLTLLFLFSLSTALSSCSSSRSVAQGDADVKRAPASASKPTSWGKPVSDEAFDFLDEVENAKARSY